MCHNNNERAFSRDYLERNDMNPSDIYRGLDYTTKQVNSFFKIKVNGLVDGKKINMLVGVSGLIKLVGVDMANKLISRALKCKSDKQECKLRRGLKVTFYYF